MAEIQNSTDEPT